MSLTRPDFKRHMSDHNSKNKLKRFKSVRNFENRNVQHGRL